MHSKRRQQHVLSNYLRIAFSLTILLGCVVHTEASDHGSLNPALITWTSNSDDTLSVLYRNKECHKCKKLELAEVSSNSNATVSMDTYYPSYYFTVINMRTKKLVCTELFAKPIECGEGASYLIQIALNDTTSTTIECTLSELVSPPYPLYLPLYVTIGILLGLGVFYLFVKCAYKRCLKLSSQYADNRMVNSEFGIAASSYVNLAEDEAQMVGMTQPTRQSQRIKSVDVLRGVSLSIMVFVNMNAGAYSTLNHAPWNGLHLADLVFPCFIFVMGVAIPLSLRAISAKSVNRVTGQRNLKAITLVRKLLIRTCLLFFFGLISSNDRVKLTELRIFGVLQRFAVCYLFCTLIELAYFKINNFTYVGINLPNGTDTDMAWNSVSKWLLIKSKFKEIFLYPLQWLFVSLLGAVWVLLTFLLPVEGCPTGYLGPGGLHENGSRFNCTGGAAGYIDRVVLGANHIYQDPTAKKIYQTEMPYDPEGILGCLTSCVLTYLGMVTGHIMIHYQEPIKRIARLTFYALLWALIGLGLCQLSWDDGWIPINKNLWSLSYIFVMASISMLAFIFLYVVIDVYDLYSGAPFMYLGRNSIVVYLGHELLGNTFPMIQVPYTHPYLLGIDVYWVAVWTVVAAIMDYYKVYVSL